MRVGRRASPRRADQQLLACSWVGFGFNAFAMTPVPADRAAGDPLTPLHFSVGLSQALNCRVLLKCEHLAPSGSFKYRGASRKLDQLGAAGERGVVTASTGNHGMAVALAGRSRNTPVVVFVPHDAEPSKVRAIAAFGAEIIPIEGGALDAERAARQRAQASAMPYISSYNDVDVIAGNATIAHEILQQAPETDAIFVSVGGGGLLSGVGAVAKAFKPKLQMVGCWPANAASLYESLAAGVIRSVAERPTLSDATAGGVEEGSITFSICQQVLDEAVCVTEAEIADAMGLVFATEGWIVEGAAGVAMAGLVRRAPHHRGQTVTVVLCGGNIDQAKFNRRILHLP
jgi:threonine dehydratase